MEEKDDKTPEQEYDAEFDKLANAKDQDPPAKQEDLDPEAEGDKENEAAPEGAEPTEKEDPAPLAEDKKPEDPPSPKGEDEGIAKALKDTKAWATKLAMEKADLEKQINALKAGGGSREQVDDAQAKVGEARKVLDAKMAKVTEDYPELKDVLDPLVKMVDSVSGEIKNLKSASDEEKKKAELRVKFESEIEPEIKKVHSDFREVAFSKEYLDWVETQSPAVKYAAYNSLDPRDISMTITEFKKFKASPEANKAKMDDEKRKEAVRKNLSSVRGGGSVDAKGKGTSYAEVDKNDYDGAWEALARKQK